MSERSSIRLVFVCRRVNYLESRKVQGAVKKMQVRKPTILMKYSNNVVNPNNVLNKYLIKRLKHSHSLVLNRAL